MATTQGRPAPEWLGRRLDTNPDKWRGRKVAPLIGATFADPANGTIAATYSKDGIGGLLRAYSLVQARYGFADLEAIARDHRRDLECVEIASQWWAQEMTNRAMNTTTKDWNDGTSSALAKMVDDIESPTDLAKFALEHLHTAASQAIGRAIGKKHPELLKALQKLKRSTVRQLGDCYAPSTEASWHTPHALSGRECARRDEWALVEIAETIEKFLEGVKQGEQEAQAKSENKGNKMPEGGGESSKWLPVIPARTNLTRPHIGKIGSKRRPTDSGRSIAYPSRAITDPHRRVFVRRQRSASALVVLDMSGSMNYTEQQLDEIIEQARGAVVVGYSAHDYESPNFYLLAKDGHRVDSIPEVCGGNGNDGTALTYAVNKYRKSASTPVVWVSDGAVTGAHDQSSADLARDMIQRLERHRVTQVERMSQAIALLERMAQGHKPAPSIGRELLRRAGF